MKYRVLLHFLRSLVYVKRFFWWTGTRVSFVIAKITGPVWRFFGMGLYKIKYGLHRVGIGKGEPWLLKRGNLQIIVLLVIFFAAVPQTKLYAKKTNYFPGQQTIAYRFTSPEEIYSVQEVVAPTVVVDQSVSAWRQGSIVSEPTMGGEPNYVSREQDMYGVVAGGTVLSRPIIIPGATAGGKRDKIVDYVVKSGDSLSGIAYKFGVSVATILWENSLTVRSVIREGNVLKIPPTTGVMYSVKKGDTLKRIADKYDAKIPEIIKFNRLKDDGTDLVIGERIMIPNGTMPEERVAVKTPSSYTSYQRASVPGRSSQGPTMSGFYWPSAVRMVTQYYNWKHHGLDIAGPMGTPNYAARAGIVEKSQCGWNSGYGCYVIINHGDGVKTLYGHHSALLVKPGDYVSAGQTIGLMGNTGNVRGVTGIHLHFEIQINGVKVNPLGYVR